jgi:hypothetical protein
MTDIHGQLYVALANRERRQLLFSLLEESPQTESPVDFDSPPDGIKGGEPSGIAYQHAHLPKLDDYGFIEWTPSVSCVEKGARFDEIEPVLEVLAEHHEVPPVQQ